MEIARVADATGDEAIKRECVENLVSLLTYDDYFQSCSDFGVIAKGTPAIRNHVRNQFFDENSAAVKKLLERNVTSIASHSVIGVAPGFVFYNSNSDCNAFNLQAHKSCKIWKDKARSVVLCPDKCQLIVGTSKGEMGFVDYNFKSIKCIPTSSDKPLDNLFLIDNHLYSSHKHARSLQSYDLDSHCFMPTHGNAHEKPILALASGQGFIASVDADTLQVQKRVKLVLLRSRCSCRII
jgi:hypothetical protein